MFVRSKQNLYLCRRYNMPMLLGHVSGQKFFHMSKGNMLLGQARGKVGDLVFSRSNGQQIVRSRAAVVRNPQTESQTIQRIILNTIAQAYSRMSEITDHSFEGVQTGAKSMNAFMKKNLNLLRTRVSEAVADGENFDGIWEFSPISTNIFALNPYLIATGSLPEVVVDSVNGTSGEGGGIVVDVPNITSGVTYRQLIEALNLQRGDQLTFCAIIGSTVANRGFKYARVILDPRAADGSAASLDEPFISNGQVNLPSPRNEGDIDAIYVQGGQLIVAVTDQSHVGGAVIVSRQSSDGTWRRSNSTMVFSTGFLLGYTLQDAIDQFYADTLDLQNELFLNNAKRASRAAANEANTATLNTYGQGASAPGSPVEVVSLSTMEVQYTPSEGNTQTVSVIAAVDVDGNKHAIINDNEHDYGYGKLLTNKAAVTSTEAWTISTGSNAVPANVLSSAVIGWENDGQVLEQDCVKWLISNGVSYGVFIREV